MLFIFVVWLCPFKDVFFFFTREWKICLNVRIFKCVFLLICREIIRRKAVLALYKFYLIAPNQVQHIHNKFRKALCDKDPGVMTASLHIYAQMIQVIIYQVTTVTVFIDKTSYSPSSLLDLLWCNPVPSHIFHFLQEKPEGYKDLAASFVAILKQVVGGKLPMDFNYHSVPAPWLQIQLLRILSLLGKNDQR